MEAVLEDALVLIVDRKISSLNDLVKLLEAVAKSGAPLLIVAEEVEGTRSPPSSSITSAAR